MKPGDLIKMIPWSPSDDHPLWFGIILEVGIPLYLPFDCEPDAVSVHWGGAGIETISTDEIEVVSESR